ncbi:hypothetical protein J6590_073882 [Homalodisca vitripennis]|nr:hypothetical protein J6590_073882 [Homalodisca vitripennis]
MMIVTVTFLLINEKDGPLNQNEYKRPLLKDTTRSAEVEGYVYVSQHLGYCNIKGNTEVGLHSGHPEVLQWCDRRNLFCRLRFPEEFVQATLPTRPVQQKRLVPNVDSPRFGYDVTRPIKKVRGAQLIQIWEPLDAVLALPKGHYRLNSSVPLSVLSIFPTGPYWAHSRYTIYYQTSSKFP